MIEATEVEVRWIDRKDRYPAPEQTVLSFCPGAEYPVWPAFSDGSGWFDACTGERIVGVTHWAEFPIGPHA